MAADEGIETAELTQQRNSALEMPVVESFTGSSRFVVNTSPLR